MLGPLFIIALFTAYAVTALILTYRNIKREEKALDERAYGDAYLDRICEEIGAATRKAGGVAASSSSSVTRKHGSHSHDGGEF